MTTISKRHVTAFLLVYIALRVFSYFFSPGTPLYTANPVNWLMSLAVLIMVVYFLAKKDERGWLIVAGETMLGGAGSFLEIKGISLRTLLLVFSITIFAYQTIREKQYNVFFKHKTILILLGALYAVVGVSAIRGYYLGNQLRFIVADVIPYLFFLYYFPLKQLLLSDHFRRVAFTMLIATILGNGLFMLGTFIGFSSGLFQLQDAYYHWFRDVTSGKITEFSYNFYRLVLNEQLLLAPLLLLLTARKITGNTSRLITALMVVLAMILSLNLTRIYILALGVGLLALFSLRHWKQWFGYNTVVVGVFLGFFVLTHTLASRGASLGLEFFGLRLYSIAKPQIEDSSLSRLLLLPKIYDKIRSYPILGTGLGDTVSIYSPIFKQTIHTPHFDWGHLEIMAEMGIVGSLLWLLMIGYIIRTSMRSADESKQGLVAALVALLVINITSPALFHVLGIAFLTFIVAHTKAISTKLSSTAVPVIDTQCANK